MENPDSLGMSTETKNPNWPPEQISGVVRIVRSLELFAGAGGLALGISRAGFSHVGVVEFDHDACTSMTENQRRGTEHIRDWPIVERDVRDLRFSSFGEGIELLAGGVPCQPWSLAGKHHGQDDQRNLFPEMIRAVRETRPKAVLIENVKGLLRQSFANYFEYILLGLTYPDLATHAGEPWDRHLRRLERHHTSRHEKGLEYRVVFRLLNAADFGVPQKRERVFIVAFRDDASADWSFPDATHSKESLASSKWVSGEYWERHRVPRKERPEPSPLEYRVARSLDLFSENLQPWLTVRDAFSGLRKPTTEGIGGWLNHTLIPGARSYQGHTGSQMDEPSKTLKAGDHGVPGGENTLVHPDGTLRYFTVREAARLQSFPDEYFFPVSWTESMRQLGNAVPVQLAEVVARSIREHLLKGYAKTQSRSAA